MHSRTRSEKIQRYDIAIIGNGTAAAGAVARLKEHFARGTGRDLQVLVLEADTEETRAALPPEYNARVTFPADLRAPAAVVDPTIITWYDSVAYYTHGASIKKPLPPRRVALVDVYRLIDRVERPLPPQITLRPHQQVFDAEYVDTPHGRAIELGVQFPFGPEKVFEETDRIQARAVIDCSGTGSLLVDRLEGYRKDSPVVCGVLAFKVIGAKLRDVHEVSLGLDDSGTHGAGSWVYPNDGLSPKLEAYVDDWFARTTNARTKQLIGGRKARAFAGTIADVGISSIAPFANAQHYVRNLERQADELLWQMPAYREMFMGAAVIPGTAFYKPSPVLQPVAQMAGERYLLAGDAAGDATPYIGEGVRPGMDMGFAAADILLESFESGDFSEKTLRSRYEQTWWDTYGHYDIWSDLFRHFSSRYFNDPQWTTFFSRLEKLTPDEFYAVLRSEYTLAIVTKMFPYNLVPHILWYQLREAGDFVFNRLTLRQAASWIR